MKEFAQQKRKPVCAVEMRVCASLGREIDTDKTWFQLRFMLCGSQRDKGLEKGQSINWAPVLTLDSRAAPRFLPA